MSKKKEGRKVRPSFNKIAILEIYYAREESPMSSTKALTDFLGSVDISIL